jgi:hypothetical protein
VGMDTGILSHLYVVYSEGLWTELVEGCVREGGLLTLASPTLQYSIELQ